MRSGSKKGTMLKSRPAEVLSVDTVNKTLKIKNLSDSSEFSDNYDKLIIATGAKPFKPKINGMNSKNVFSIKNPQNAVEVRGFYLLQSSEIGNYNRRRIYRP